MDPDPVTWSPVKLRWPVRATQWLDGLSAARALASGELAGTDLRLKELKEFALTQPGPVGEAARAGVETGRQALVEQLMQAPSSTVISPFQPGVGSGRGQQRFLSAPEVIQRLAEALLWNPTHPANLEQHALVILFLANRFDQLASALNPLSTVLPVPELVRAERRAIQMAQLEITKWEQPSARSAAWQPLPLERCTVTKAARQLLSGQLAMLEGYLADSSPMSDLAAMAQQKMAQEQSRDQQLQALKNSFAGSNQTPNLLALKLGPGDARQLQEALLEAPAPGHEWVLCAGLLLTGSEQSLSFVQELTGL